MNGTVKITVPVHLAQIPAAFNRFEVVCAFRTIGENRADFGSGPLAEVTTQAHDLVGGTFNGNLVLTIQQSVTPPVQINGYACDLEIFGPSGIVNLGAPSGINNQYGQGAPAPGTPFTGAVQGSF